MTEKRDEEVTNLNDITMALSLLSLRKETGITVPHEKQKVHRRKPRQKKREKKIKSAKKEEKLKDKPRTKSSFSPISKTSVETSEFFRSRVNNFGGFPTIKRTKARKHHGSCDELSDLSSTPTEIPTRTPQPEVFTEFTEFKSGFATRSRGMRTCPYKPRYCWCARCQLMYRLYREADSSLNNWGNYPRFQF